MKRRSLFALIAPVLATAALGTRVPAAAQAAESPCTPYRLTSDAPMRCAEHDDYVIDQMEFAYAQGRADGYNRGREVEGARAEIRSVITGHRIQGDVRFELSPDVDHVLTAVKRESFVEAFGVAYSVNDAVYHRVPGYVGQEG